MKRHKTATKQRKAVKAKREPIGEYVPPWWDFHALQRDMASRWQTNRNVLTRAQHDQLHSVVAPRFQEAVKSAELRKDLDAANQRLEEFHEILARKNAIIRLLAMGDLTAADLKTE